MANWLIRIVLFFVVLGAIGRLFWLCLRDWRIEREQRQMEE